MSDLTKPPHVPSCVSTGEGVTVPTATATRFTITWTQQGYKVSRPNIEEAEVVLASDYDAAQAALAEAQHREKIATTAGLILKAALAEAKAEVARLKTERDHLSESVAEFSTQSTSLYIERDKLRAEIVLLREEIEVLRNWGNNDCEAMADAELERRRLARIAELRKGQP